MFITNKGQKLDLRMGVVRKLRPNFKSWSLSSGLGCIEWFVGWNFVTEQEKVVEFYFIWTSFVNDPPRVNLINLNVFTKNIFIFSFKKNLGVFPQHTTRHFAFKNIVWVCRSRKKINEDDRDENSERKRLKMKNLFYMKRKKNFLSTHHCRICVENKTKRNQLRKNIRKKIITKVKNTCKSRLSGKTLSSCWLALSTEEKFRATHKNCFMS